MINIELLEELSKVKIDVAQLNKEIAVVFYHPRGQNVYYLVDGKIDSWYVTIRTKTYFDDDVEAIEKALRWNKTLDRASKQTMAIDVPYTPDCNWDMC